MYAAQYEVQIQVDADNPYHKLRRRQRNYSANICQPTYDEHPEAVGDEDERRNRSQPTIGDQPLLAQANPIRKN